MSRLIFKDGSELEVLAVERGPLFYDGTNRNGMVIYIDPAVTGLDVADSWFRSKEKTQAVKIQVAEADGTVYEENQYDYTIPVEVSKKTVGGDYNNGITGEVRIVVTLAKKTCVELQNEKILEQLAALGISL